MESRQSTQNGSSFGLLHRILSLPTIAFSDCDRGTFCWSRCSPKPNIGPISGALGRTRSRGPAIANANQSGSGVLASVVSVVALLFGVSGVFAQLQGALNSAWEVKAKPKLGIWAFIRSRFLSFSMVLVIAFLLVVSLVVSAGLAALNEFTNNLLPGAETLWQIVNFGVSLVILALLVVAA